MRRSARRRTTCTAPENTSISSSFPHHGPQSGAPTLFVSRQRVNPVAIADSEHMGQHGADAVAYDGIGDVIEWRLLGIDDHDLRPCAARDLHRICNRVDPQGGAKREKDV